MPKSHVIPNIEICFHVSCTTIFFPFTFSLQTGWKPSVSVSLNLHSIPTVKMHFFFPIRKETLCTITYSFSSCQGVLLWLYCIHVIGHVFFPHPFPSNIGCFFTETKTMVNPCTTKQQNTTLARRIRRTFSTSIHPHFNNVPTRTTRSLRVSFRGACPFQNHKKERWQKRCK